MAFRYSNIPSVQTSVFVGRDTLLQSIHDEFENPPAELKSPLVVVLYGVGGSGKSEVALEYCRRRQTRGIRGVWRINAQTAATTVQSLTEIAMTMAAKRFGGLLTNPVTSSFVTDELATWSDRWLMVFDNYDDPKGFNSLPTFFPPGKYVRLLTLFAWNNGH